MKALLFFSLLMSYPMLAQVAQQNRADTTTAAGEIKSKIDAIFDTLTTVIDQKLSRQAPAKKHLVKKRRVRIKEVKAPGIDTTAAITVNKTVYDSAALITERPQIIAAPKKIKWYLFRQRHLQKVQLKKVTK